MCDFRREHGLDLVDTADETPVDAKGNSRENAGEAVRVKFRSFGECHYSLLAAAVGRDLKQLGCTDILEDVGQHLPRHREDSMQFEYRQKAATSIAAQA
jgi:hypothetical protein